MTTIVMVLDWLQLFWFIIMFLRETNLVFRDWTSRNSYIAVHHCPLRRPDSQPCVLSHPIYFWNKSCRLNRSWSSLNPQAFICDCESTVRTVRITVALVSPVREPPAATAKRRRLGTRGSYNISRTLTALSRGLEHCHCLTITYRRPSTLSQ